MERLREEQGTTATLRALRFLSIRLRSRQTLAALADPIDGVRRALEEAEERYQQAREERIAATAEVEWRDEFVDNAVMDLSRHLLAEVSGDRNAPRFRRLFAQSPAALVSGIGSDQQTRFVRSLLAELADAQAWPTMQDHTRRIASAQDELEAALRHREELYVPEAQTLAARRAALVEAQRVYNRMHPRLLLEVDDAALVESMFVRGRRAGRESPADDPADSGEG